MPLRCERVHRCPSLSRFATVPCKRVAQRSACALLLLSIFAACTSEPGPAQDAGEGNGHPARDGTVRDGAASPSVDGGARDACTRDAGTRDAGTRDAGTRDAETERDGAIAVQAGVPAPDAGFDAGAREGGPSDAAVPSDACVNHCQPHGHWTTGDLHVHTIQSNDAQTSLRRVLEAAFDESQLDSDQPVQPRPQWTWAAS